MKDYGLYRDTVDIDTDHDRPALGLEIDRLRAEIIQLKSNGRPDIQSDAERLYYWLSDLYSLLDRFPDFTGPHNVDMNEAISDCRELLSRCKEAFDDCGMCWMVELEIHFGGQSE